jgi:hypothetical protein
MQETTDSRYKTGNVVCDAVRFINDAAYAVLPRDVAHRLGELEKNFWGGVRWLVDKELEWINDRIAGSDRLREDWQQQARREESERSAGDGI